MDRVDVSSDGASLRVVDYKSGSSEGVSKDKVKGGTKLQLPFYLWALKCLYPGKKASQSLYDYITSKGKYRRVSYDGTDPARVEGVLGTVLKTAVENVEAGIFPAAGKACEHCDYRKLCGTGMEARGKRKKGDPQAGTYYALEDLK